MNIIEIWKERERARGCNINPKKVNKEKREMK